MHLKRLHGQLGDVVYQLTKIHFSKFFPPHLWRPALNAYRCRDCIKICMDLAGVDREAIDIQLEPGRLVIRGQRGLPEPEDSDDQPLRILAMEIDYGQFEREVSLPSTVDEDRVTARQSNGLLWIHLPLRAHA